MDQDNATSTFLSVLKQQELDGLTEPEAIAALILSATQDDNPTFSLDQIYSNVSQNGMESHLDPLGVLPYLLPSCQPAALNLIALIGECGNAKEVVVAVQEILERVDAALDSEEEDDQEEDSITKSPSEQLISLIHLYNSAIPRLRLQKRSPSDTIRPLLSQIQSTIQLAGPLLQRDQGRGLISSVSALSTSVLGWATGFNETDLPNTKAILQNLLDTVVSQCSHCIQSSLAQRSFENLYPRFTVRSTASPGWEDGQVAVEDALASYSKLGQPLSRSSLPAVPSTAILVLFAHAKTVPPNVDIYHVLSFLLPIIVASIQINRNLDEVLSLLLQWLHPTHFPSAQQLSPDISGPLSALLPTLASAHPDSDTRHQAFRILSRVLSLTPPELRLQILKDLVTDTEFPQMRVAAVGLVKEAILEALTQAQHAGKATSVFASPICLQVFGPILFRSDPIDLFSRPGLTIDDLEDSMEPSRLVECLSLYYILLLRDNLNLTGVRDQISNIEKTLLTPLRGVLTRWMDDTSLSGEHMHAIMPLVSLKTSVERVDSAISNLQS
ncbi:hypothetical protein R3P38DRAFT_2525446 [Favolaschia claudopus]|uniref:RNA polymerase II assembly factor Rtp1 C-terminal domain-containing protein n=1 Tax=Favolaschia claudopus TaxID=2862362 RepID=A0AAW0BPE7_9AGAR